MRIRKHASMVLGTASSPQRVDLSTAAWMMMMQQQQHPYSCEVNRSRWDVLPYPPLGEASDKEEEQEKGSTMGDDEEEIEGGREEEAAAAMSAITSRDSSSSNNTAELRPKEMEELATSNDQQSEEDDWKPNEKKRANKAKKGNTFTTTTTMRGAAKSSTTTAYTCKKTDGKQWRCKVPVDQPNSLCGYHLDQILSYRCTSNTSRKPRQAAPVRKTPASSLKRLPRPSAVASAGLESMYYYSAFGPWRGKQRGVEPAAAAAAAAVNDDSEDSSEEDTEESSTKKKRRPVKARSLKSLL